jgi:hypothetical protein
MAEKRLVSMQMRELSQRIMQQRNPPVKDRSLNQTGPIELSNTGQRNKQKKP